MMAELRGASEEPLVAPLGARPVPIEGARDVLARQGRSFHWASRLLGRAEAERAALLYAFCRRLDDLADEGGRTEADAAFNRVRHELSTGRSDDPLVDAFLEIARARDIPGEAAVQLVVGLESDLHPVRIQTFEELVRYAYRVAGTVGVMMARALEARGEQALPFAVDLGIAMQLTNIARDVLEDARRDRLYLPSEWLSAGVTPAALAAGRADACQEASLAVLRLLDAADPYYRSADQGLRFLPARARCAIRVAARLYEAIGDEIRQHLRHGDRSRAVVGPWRKLVITVQALAHEALETLAGKAAPVHEARLHRSIAGLPGVDPAARAPAPRPCGAGSDRPEATRMGIG